MSKHSEFEPIRHFFLLNMLAESLHQIERFLFLSPEEHYRKLTSQLPDIVNRVPDKYIASMLGITPVSLSRIRKRMHEKPRHQLSFVKLVWPGPLLSLLKTQIMEQLTNFFLAIFNATAIRYFVIAGLPFLLFYVWRAERFRRLKIQERLASRKDFLREIAHSLGTTAVFAVIGVLVLYTPFRQYTLIYDNLTDFPIWYIPVSLVLSLIFHDTYFYWLHRLLHHERIFRYVHLVHHKSVNPSPWTSYSFHFLESVAEGAVLIVLVLVLPMHPLTAILFTLISFMINVYGHLGFEIAPRSFRNTKLFEVLSTSVHHNLHHSRFKGNYGLYFRVWDRLMGTEHPDYVKEYDRIQAQRFGTRGNAKRP